MARLPPDAFCVIGLGNPGEEYRHTRHNVGFQVVDVVAARWNVDIRRPEFRALTAEAKLGRSMVLLVKPQTFMNASGCSAAEIVSSLGISPERLLAVYDDLDLPLGRLRVRPEGGAGGHRGIASMIQELGTQAFPRIRVGIARPPVGTPVIEHVLTPFHTDEADDLERAVSRAADALESFVARGITPTMESFNVR